MWKHGAASTISIHALLAESDHAAEHLSHGVKVISIHALLAESDHTDSYRMARYSGFLSTLSLRRATAADCIVLVHLYNFYPRSPCGERRPERCRNTAKAYFYPRSPCGERHVVSIVIDHMAEFLSTLSLRRATVRSSLTLSPSLFLSTLSLRRATYIPLVRYLLPGISIHALLAESDWNALAFLF